MIDGKVAKLLTLTAFTPAEVKDHRFCVCQHCPGTVRGRVSDERGDTFLVCTYHYGLYVADGVKESTYACGTCHRPFTAY